MPYRSLIGVVALTALSVSICGAQAADGATYPDWKGQWTRFVVRGLPGQPSHDRASANHHSAASLAVGPSSSGISSPSISRRLRPAIPCRSPYSPAVDSTTPRICSSRFAHSRISGPRQIAAESLIQLGWQELGYARSDSYVRWFAARTDTQLEL